MPGICIVFPRTVLYSLKNSPVPPKELFQCALKYVYVGSDRVLSTLGRQQWWSSSPQWPILQPVNIKQHFLPFSLKKKERISKGETLGALSFLSVHLETAQTSWMIPVLLFKGINDRVRLGGFLSRNKITPWQHSAETSTQIGLYKRLQFQPSFYCKYLPDVYHSVKANENVAPAWNEICALR